MIIVFHVIAPLPEAACHYGSQPPQLPVQKATLRTAELFQKQRSNLYVRTIDGKLQVIVRKDEHTCEHVVPKPPSYLAVYEEVLV
ncbi:hypothetical protein AC578_926 [Pseudocercospora eumusae]|uniref:Uncharacterized protein n=1 Tax=Pseudocercospora eumusae TaxID=321146 RepID=A0A139HBW4_9PEZI|nr:hypothetical protein AC578_926 [Pseudocercospora eumusae]